MKLVAGEEVAVMKVTVMEPWFSMLEASTRRELGETWCRHSTLHRVSRRTSSAEKVTQPCRLFMLRSCVSMWWLRPSARICFCFCHLFANANVCLSVSLSISLYSCLSVCFSACAYVDLVISPSVCPRACLCWAYVPWYPCVVMWTAAVCLNLLLPLRICPPVCLSLFQSLCICALTCLSLCLCVCRSDYQLICLSSCPVVLSRTRKPSYADSTAQNNCVFIWLCLRRRNLI